MEVESGYNTYKNNVRQKIYRQLQSLPDVFTNYILSLYESRKTDSTVQVYLSTLLTCLKDIGYTELSPRNLSFLQISPIELSRYFEDKERAGSSRLQQNWSVLNSFFSFLKANGLISTNPILTIPRPTNIKSEKQQRPLSSEELDKLFTAIASNTRGIHSVRDNAIVKLAIATGIDLFDIVNLNTEEVDLNNKYITIINKKGERKAPISEQTVKVLKEWRVLRDQIITSDTENAFFVSSMKSRISVDAISRMLKSYCLQAQIPPITFKDLRSTMIYLLAQEGVSMRSILTHLDISEYEKVAPIYDLALRERECDILPAIDTICQHENTSNPFAFLDVPCQLSMWIEDESIQE